MTDGISLKSLLEIISYDILITALGFSVAGAFLFQSSPNVSRALGLTAGVLILIATATHRLANR